MPATPARGAGPPPTPPGRGGAPGPARGRAPAGGPGPPAPPAGGGGGGAAGVVGGGGIGAPGRVAVIGTRDGAAIGVDLALALAAEVLRVVENHPQRPILM